MPSTFFPELKVKRLSPDVPMPAYAHRWDAGLDLCATKDVTLLPGESYKMGSGIMAAIPNGFAGLVLPRSGLGSKGLVIKTGVGLIDATYRGEIGLPLMNNNPTHFWQKTRNERLSEKLKRVIYNLLLRPCTNQGNVSAEGTSHVHAGDRVAQLVIIPVGIVRPVEVEDLDETERADGGFGSSGVRYERP